MREVAKRGIAGPGRDMRSELAVFVRHRLDISLRDFLFGLQACVRQTRRKDVTENILRKCSLEDNGLVCLSVRTGFDLLLGVLKWPADTEVLVSAITHPDMIRIIQAHRLRPIPVDINPETLSPYPASLEAALTPRTKAVLVANLFGGTIDLDPIASFARENNLLLFEDCAQAFQGPDLCETPSDVSMYSFGPIKTATALGGAVFCIKDTKLLQEMRVAENRCPSQSRGEYATRTLKYLTLSLVSRPVPYGLLVRSCRLLRRDLDGLLAKVTGSFPQAKHQQFFRHIRRRPSVPLLSLLNRRLHNFDYTRLARRALVGERASRLLEPHGTVLGLRTRRRTHWVVPVLSARPEALTQALKGHRFDASYATSNLVALEALPGRCPPREASRIMSKIVFLPVYPELPEGALDLLARTVSENTI